MVKALHEAGIEVILDVVYNHTAEGNHLGPDAVVQGHRQPRLLPPGRRRPALLHGLHGHRQQPQHAPPARAAADHGQPALLGHGDARRRVPLRPRRRRWPAELHEVDRLSAFFDLIQQDPVDQPGEADRRAVGRRRGRLPGRQLPAAVVGVERPLPRQRPRLLAGRAGDAGRVRLPLHRQLRPLPGRRPRARRASSTSSPPTTASRSPTSCRYNEKHNEANGEDNHDGESHNRSWNCGAEGPTDDPEIIALRARQQRNFLATLLLSQGVPMLLRRRRDRPHAAGQQQRLLPGQRDLVVRLGATVDEPTCSTSPAGSSRCAARTPCFTGGRLVPGGRSPPRGDGAADIAWFTPDGAEMADEDWERRAFAKCLAVFLNGDGLPGPRPPAASASSTTASCCSSTPTTRTMPFTLPDGDWASALGRGDRHGRPSSGRDEPQTVKAGDTVAVDGRLGAGAARPRIRG